MLSGRHIHLLARDASRHHRHADQMLLQQPHGILPDSCTPYSTRTPCLPIPMHCHRLFSLQGHNYLVIVDRYSNWPIVEEAAAGLMDSLQPFCHIYTASVMNYPRMEDLNSPPTKRVPFSTTGVSATGFNPLPPPTATAVPKWASKR